MNDKRALLTILIVAVLAIVALATARPDRGYQRIAPPVRDGQTARDVDDAVVENLAPLALPEPLVVTAKAILLWIVLPLSLIFALVDRRTWGNISRDLRMLLIMATVLYLVIQAIGPALQSLAPSPTVGGAGGDLVAGELPRGAASVLLTVSILLIVTGALWLRRLRQAQQRPDGGAAAYGQAAETALAALARGESFESAITRCYRRMTEIAAEVRGLHRHEAATAREFAGELLAAGLPADAVRHLTHAFERVRYGHAALPSAEEEAARAALHHIAQALDGREVAADA